MTNLTRSVLSWEPDAKQVLNVERKLNVCLTL